MVVESNSNIGIVHNFLMNVEGYSSDIQMQLQTMVTNLLEDLFEIKGAFVVTSGSSETQIYSKSISDFSKISEVADLISTFDQRRFFKTISGPGFTQIDCIKYNSYQIYFARVTNDHSIFILFADSRRSFGDVVHSIGHNLRQEMKNITQKISLIPNPVVFVDSRDVVESTNMGNASDSTKFNIPVPGI